MKKRIFLISYIVLMCLFVGYLFMADSIIYRIGTEKNFLSRVEAYNEDYSINPNGVVNVNIMSSRDDLLRTVEIQGLAGIPTDADNTDAYARLVFKGEKNSYIIDAYLGFSGEINNIFKTQGIKGTVHKFKAEYSSIPMKNGIYRLYVYYHENDDSFGLIDTYKIFEKNENGISEYVPSQTENVSYKNTDSIFAYFNQNQSCSDGKYYRISGVAANSLYDSVGAKIYLEFTFEDGNVVTYDTVVAKDWWTGTNLNKKYHESSFYAKVPKKVINGKNVQMRILVDNQGVYSYNRVFSLEFDNLGYIIKDSKRIYTEKIQNFTDFNLDMNVSSDVWTAFKENESKDGYIFYGISYVAGLNSVNSKAYLECRFADGSVSTYPLTLGVNNWMLENYGEAYANCQFKAEISKGDFSQQDVFLSLIIENDGNVYRSQNAVEYVYLDGTFAKRQ